MTSAATKHPHALDTALQSKDTSRWTSSTHGLTRIPLGRKRGRSAARAGPSLAPAFHVNASEPRARWPLCR